MVALSHEAKWQEVKTKFETGQFKSLKELADSHGVSYQALRKRAERELWKERMSQMSQKIEEKILSKAEEYLDRKYSRVLRYEKMIDASQAQQSTTNEGIPLLDVDQIGDYVLAESRLHDIGTSCLRISDKVDVTSGGKDIGSSFVEALQKLRETDKSPALTSSEVDKILEMDIIE